MAEILNVLRQGSRYRPDTVAVADDQGELTGRDLVARIAGLAAVLQTLPQRIGLLGGNGCEWMVAQLAAWAAGKTVVPMPSFFSRPQLDHLLRDAGIDHVVATSEAIGPAAALGIAITSASAHVAASFPELSQGGGTIVYTSGSTGRPKGVCLNLDQIDFQARALAAAIEAKPSDCYLSVLPLALLLETIAAICLPVLVGGKTQFASVAAAAIGAGRPLGLLGAFERHRPTATVLVPQLLSVLVAELEASGRTAPDSLRYVAVGGARVPEALAARAWDLGIPVYEGYGLTECCSVVAVNRPGRRKPGTVGEPLPGLDVTIAQGEVVVRGPTVMQRYLHGAKVNGSWRTGDCGSLGADGFLRISGRMDTLIVTASGRNIAPEWIETLVISDPRVAACVALDLDAERLSMLIVPSPPAERWLLDAPPAHVRLWLERLCAGAPAHAVPGDYVICPVAEAKRLELLTASGRIVRRAARAAYPALKLARQPALA